MMWTTSIKLLRVNHVPSDFREPFIVSGYRSCRSSVSTCILSAFSLNNETFNIWTHFLTSAWFIWMSNQWLWYELRFDVDPFTYPLQVFLASVCLMMVVSCTAHIFNCMSERVHHMCFFFDYGAISIYTLGCCIVHNAYAFPKCLINSTFHNLYMPCCVVNSLLCTILGCVARLTGCKVLRITTFMIQYVICTFPLLYRCVFPDGDDTHSIAIPFHIYQFMLCALTLLIYGARFPEVLAPGKFDIIGHSHQLFHVVSSLATYFQLQANMLDMQQRRSYLLSVLPMPTLADTAGIVLVVLILNLIIIGCFTRMIWKKQFLRRVKQKQGILTIGCERFNNNSFKKE